MTISPWQRRIQRAQELAEDYPFASQILDFYVRITRFQEELHQALRATISTPRIDCVPPEIDPETLKVLTPRFDALLSLVEAHGPKALAELSRELHASEQTVRSDLLQDVWGAHSASDAQGLLAWMFLQPYAELLRASASLRPASASRALCPFCNRKPVVAVLRQLGDGGARSMVCSFCLAEWEFRRLVCPGCGEENDKQLPIFTASTFDYIRVESCDTCKTYIKSVDLTKNGHAEPLVDELVSAPLDLWADEHGYAKLQINVLGM